MISSIKIRHDSIKWIDRSWSRRCKCSTKHSTASLHLKQILSYKQLLFLSSNWRLTWPKSKKEKTKARIWRQMFSKTSWRRNVEFSTSISLLMSQRSTRSHQMSHLTSTLDCSAANILSKSWKSTPIWKPWPWSSRSSWAWRIWTSLSLEVSALTVWYKWFWQF